jgi:hypothetical protein
MRRHRSSEKPIIGAIETISTDNGARARAPIRKECVLDHTLWQGQAGKLRALSRF